MNRILSLFLCLGLGATALAQNLKEGPWFNYNVNGINRLPARATSYSYDDQAKALAGDREASRMVSLNGTWKFKFAEDLPLAPMDFYTDGYENIQREEIRYDAGFSYW